MNKSNLKYRDIDEYHTAQPANIREMLEQLRFAIKQAAPMATETISYGMPAFRLNKVLVYYACNKKHIGFYPAPNSIVHFKNELEDYKTSKGAIQFQIDKPLPLSLIKRIVEFRIEEEKNEYFAWCCARSAGRYRKGIERKRRNFNAVEQLDSNPT